MGQQPPTPTASEQPQAGDRAGGNAGKGGPSPTEGPHPQPWRGLPWLTDSGSNPRPARPRALGPGMRSGPQAPTALGTELGPPDLSLLWTSRKKEPSSPAASGRRLPSPPSKGRRARCPLPQVAQERPHRTAQGRLVHISASVQRELLPFPTTNPPGAGRVPLHACREFPQQKGMCRPSDLGNTQSLQSKLDGVAVQ